jgi:diphthine-ammonia ligase
MERLRAGVLFSGGKDSTYAALAASREAELRCLVTVVPAHDASYMFHFPNLRWTTLQSEAMGVPQVLEDTAGVKEAELADLGRALTAAQDRFKIEALYTGALASVYQKERVEKVCSDLGLKCVSPLWGTDPEAHLHNLLREGFVTVVTSVSALGLDRGWLGRELDEKAVRELASLSAKYRFHAGFEGGEGETFVVDCPLFSKRIQIQRAEVIWEGDRGRFEIEEAHLIPKPRIRVGAA